MSSTNFLFDTRDVKFVMKEWLDLDHLLSMPAYRDYYSKDDVDSFVDVAFKIARDVIGPANEASDKIGAQFIDGKVVTPEPIKVAYRTVMEAGLGPQVADREVEGRMPICMNAPLGEMFISASSAIPTYWGLTAGAAGVIQKHADQKYKDLYLEKMFSGEWGGTMNLTEPGAGSDVGACVTKAFTTDTPGLYKLKGTKMFITSGDHDIASNFIHLVLGRLEGARPGTAGLSLFMVPKYWVSDDGSMGEWNDVTTVGIEHKMGLKGSATCTLAFGENDKCYGYIIGNPPGEDGKGEGMAQMFDMMNEERLGTGLLALGTTSQAYYNALAYSKERIQGTKLTDPKGPKVRIIEHEDVRRMLLGQKSCIEAIRAMIYKTYYYIDLLHDSDNEEEREFADAMFQFQNPLCKAYASDMAWPLIGDAIQTYGGYGFIEEYAPAQLARDVKIFSIWEGTNFIQSLDLVGRKFTSKKGKYLMTWLGEVHKFIAANKLTPGFEKQFEVLESAFQAYQGMLGTLQGYLKEGKIPMMPLYSTRILHATAMINCGMLILDQALLASNKLDELGEDHFDANFYKGKIASGKFYVMNIVPQVHYLKTVFELGDTSAIDCPEEGLG
ncbi:MAG: acyl-CoA dehydrogenase [Solirubrobacterales bacterium]